MDRPGRGIVCRVGWCSLGGSDGFEDVLTDLRREYCECVIFYLEPYDDRFEVGDPLAK